MIRDFFQIYLFPLATLLFKPVIEQKTPTIFTNKLEMLYLNVLEYKISYIFFCIFPNIYIRSQKEKISYDAYFNNYTLHIFS